MTEHTPSDYSLYRMQKAKETLKEVKSHIESGYWNTAMNRMYYACFYAVGVLLVEHNIITTSLKIWISIC